MRLQQFITEKTEDTEKIIEMLHKDCSEYFDNIQFGVKSFRGHKGISGIYEKITPRTDRKPRDMPLEVHERLSKSLKRKFKWNPREEGVFVTGVLEEAEGFGTPYYFYPSNGFKMVWNTKIFDIFEYLRAHGYVKKGKVIDDEYVYEISKIMRSYKSGGPKDINTALQSGNEVAFKCKFYYLVDIDFVTNNFDDIYYN